MSKAISPVPPGARVWPGVASKPADLATVAALSLRDLNDGARSEGLAHLHAQRSRAQTVKPVPVVVWIGTSAAFAAESERSPGDLAIDLESIAATLSAQDMPHVRHVALAAVASAIRAASKLREGYLPHVVHPDATPRQVLRYLAKGYAVRQAGTWPIDVATRAPDRETSP